MIKRIVALAATALCSLNASAAYVQYDFNGPLTGYFIQHDDDGSIAYFRIDVPIAGAPTTNPNGFRLGLVPQQSEGATYIYSPTTYFRNNGPTNFHIFSDFGGDQLTNFGIDFSRSTQNDFSYTASYSTSIYFTGGFQYFTGTLAGTLSKGTVDPLLAQNLDYLGGYSEHVSRNVPTYIAPGHVPEPGSIALLGIGALCAAGVTRRRKSVAGAIAAIA